MLSIHQNPSNMKKEQIYRYCLENKHLPNIITETEDGFIFYTIETPAGVFNVYPDDIHAWEDENGNTPTIEDLTNHINQTLIFQVIAAYRERMDGDSYSSADGLVCNYLKEDSEEIVILFDTYAGIFTLSQDADGTHITKIDSEARTNTDTEILKYLNDNLTI